MNTNTVWNLYADDIKQFIYSKVNDTNNTEDILQDTFIKIHTKLHSLKDETKLKSWIFTIARNTILDFFKTNKPQQEISHLNLIDNFNYKDEHSEQDCLRGIIKNLPKKYRSPLFLADIKGLKQQEVATILNQNLTTTKSQIQRARKLIAKGFMDCCGFQLNENGKLVGEVQEKKDCKVCR